MSDVKYVLPPDGYLLTNTTRRTICLHCLEPIEMGEDVFWVESDGVFHKDCCVKHPNVQESRRTRAGFREKA